MRTHTNSKELGRNRLLSAAWSPPLLCARYSVQRDQKNSFQSTSTNKSFLSVFPACKKFTTETAQSEQRIAEAPLLREEGNTTVSSESATLTTKGRRVSSKRDFYLKSQACEREGWNREKARTVENCGDCIHAHLHDIGRVHINQNRSVCQKDTRSICFLIILQSLLHYCSLAYKMHLLEGSWQTEKTVTDCKGTKIKSLTFPSKPTFTSITQNIGFHDTIIYNIRQVLINNKSFNKNIHNLLTTNSC